MTAIELSPLLPQVVECVNGYLAERRIPGLCVGIVRSNELAWWQAFGFADVAAQRAIDQHTLFRVASITKTFTATAILQLRDASRLSLDDPLQEHIPEFSSARATAGSLAGVTIRRMLAHHAGLTTEAPLPCWDARAFPTRGELLQAIQRVEVVIPQDSAVKYSNLAFGLLGEVVSRVGGRCYADYLTTEILQPLGLKSTVFELNEDQQRRLATGYSPGQPWEIAAPISLNGLAACGGLYSSPADLARWIGHQFPTSPQRSETQVLAASTIRESHRPQYLEADWSVGYCLGWRAHRRGDRVFHGHGGGIFGFSSQILFSQLHQLGLICLANVWPRAGLQELGLELLELVLAGQALSTPPPVDTADAVAAELRQLLGSYTAGPGIQLAVESRGGVLQFAHLPGCDYALHAPASLEQLGTPHEFVVRGGRGSGERIVFEPSGEPDAWQFTLGGFVYRAAADSA